MNKRDRVIAANEIADIVFTEVKRVWPDLHPVFDLRYGIADAVLAAGYRRPEPDAKGATVAECVFCQRIRRGQFLDSYILAPMDVVWFEPLNPVTPGHMLFVPREHCEHSHRIAVASAMQAAARYAMGRDEDFNLITSSGPAATQTIPHIHVHYVPRRPGDGLPLPWTTQHAPEPDVEGSNR